MEGITIWQALGAIIKVLPEFIDTFKRIGQLARDRALADLLKDLNDAARLTENAKTPEDRMAAARAWDRVVGRV